MKPNPTPRPPTDLRAQRRDINRRLLGLVLFVLVVVGSALIAAFYGLNAALVAMACLVSGALVIGLLWLVFTLIEKWAGAE
jgi:fatty acid desaturase